MNTTKAYIWSLTALMTTALAACSEKDNPGGEDSGNGVEVGIKTEVTLNTKTALIQKLDDGHEMNVWINVASDMGAVLSTDQLHATNTGGTWKLDKTVRIDKGQTAEIYAFYPYTPSATDVKAVPLDVTTQDDVLYSGAATYASYTANVATLNMKHAFSMVAVNVAKEGYAGSGVISRVKLAEPALIATKGTIDVTSGKITATEYGELAVDVNATIGETGINGLLPGMWVIPFSSKDQDPVKITLTIDGKDYTVDLPEVTMGSGWQYVFHAVLTPHGLVFVPDATEEYSLNKADDTMTGLTGHGVITFMYAGQTFLFPTFTGDNVYGNVKAADGSQANFSIGGSMNLSSGASQQVVVETWNSTGFSIVNIDGIDAIDLSAY